MKFGFMNKTGLRRVVRSSVRMYFAPLTGAIHGVRSELRREKRDIEKRTQPKPLKDATTA